MWRLPLASLHLHLADPFALFSLSPSFSFTASLYLMGTSALTVEQFPRKIEWVFSQIFDSPASEREGFPESNPSTYGTGSARERRGPVDKGSEDGGKENMEEHEKACLGHKDDSYSSQVVGLVGMWVAGVRVKKRSGKVGNTQRRGIPEV